MGFALVAEFPLGTYRGHRSDGGLDLLPTPARLHAALLAAAGQGARAEADGASCVPRAADRRALAWLETHPPDALGVPPTMADSGLVGAYRPEGFFGIREQRRVFETRADRLGSVALGAPIAWIWDDDPPPAVADALEALCAEVPYLGTGESPVVLRVATAAPTHRLDPGAGLVSGGGIDVEIPRPGRTAALERAHAADPRTIPSMSADRPARAEGAVVQPVIRDALARARYVPLTGPAPDAPWPTVVLLPVDDDLPADVRVAWAVALHRALVARIGDGAPALITGRYEQGVPRPANRLAIQYVPAAVPAAPTLRGAGAFALLIPAGAEGADLAVLDGAVRALDELGLGTRRVIRLHEARHVLAGDAFWAPVPAGQTRVWVTAVAAIPESRPVRGRGWTIGDAALLSLGLVLRDRFPRPVRRADWYASLVEGVAASGASVLEAHKLNDAGTQRWVHRVTAESAVQPYRAALRLGSLVGERTLLAIGQSRHLGGGLLVPLDLPAELVAESQEGGR
jgi:CRISPR-associated protein Csb2